MAGTEEQTGAESTPPVAGLSGAQRELLRFEREWWSLAGSKDTAIREALGTTSEDYYRELNALLDLPAALEADPLLVRRLRRQRLTRQRERQARRGSRAGG